MITPQAMKRITVEKLEPDVFIIPLTSQALLPIHNLPLNSSDPQLVLDMTTLARIWTGAIPTWDHPV
jgi:hypothetical protein